MRRVAYNGGPPASQACRSQVVLDPLLLRRVWVLHRLHRLPLFKGCDLLQVDSGALAVVLADHAQLPVLLTPLLRVFLDQRVAGPVPLAAASLSVALVNGSDPSARVAALVPRVEPLLRVLRQHGVCGRGRARGRSWRSVVALAHQPRDGSFQEGDTAVKVFRRHRCLPVRCRIPAGRV